MSRLVGTVAAALALAAGSGLAGCADGMGGLGKPAPVAATSRCGGFSFPVYFPDASASLTPEASRAVNDAAVRTKGCIIDGVRVVGLSAAPGSAAANLELSKRRADAVAAALASSGLPAPTFDVEAAGEAGAVAPDGTPRPLRRRSEVFIQLSPPR